MDETVRLNDDFRLASVPTVCSSIRQGPVFHYSRQTDGTILRVVVHEGTLILSPPGIEVGVAELLAEPPG